MANPWQRGLRQGIYREVGSSSDLHQLRRGRGDDALLGPSSSSSSSCCSLGEDLLQEGDGGAVPLDLQEGYRGLVQFLVEEKERGAGEDDRHAAFFRKIKNKRERMMQPPQHVKLLSVFVLLCVCVFVGPHTWGWGRMFAHLYVREETCHKCHTCHSHLQTNFFSVTTPTCSWLLRLTLFC